MTKLAATFSLPDQQKQQLLAFVRHGRAAARAITRAHVLLHFGKGESALAIAKRFNLHTDTVRAILERYETAGLEGALFDRPRPGQPKHFTSQQVQHITALDCQTPPLGHAHWTLADLKAEILQRQIAPKISRQTIARILHHHDLHPWREKNVVHS